MENSNIVIKKCRTPIMVKNKYNRNVIKREGEIYYEINYFNGFWNTARETFKTLKEAKAEAKKYII